LVDGGLTQIETAERVGVSRRSLGAWCNEDADFQQEYERQRLTLYQSDLLYARNKLRKHLDHEDAKVNVSAAKVLVDADVGYSKAHGQVTHHVILDKLRQAVLEQDSEALEAEYTAMLEAPEREEGTASDTSEDSEGPSAST
jgi:hypothetical protein